MKNPTLVAIVVHERLKRLRGESEYEAGKYAEMLNKQSKRADDNASFQPRFKAEVFSTVEEAQHFLAAYKDGGILLIFSSLFLRRAKDLAKKLKPRKIRVYVITGEPPNGQPVVMPNIWPGGRIEILADLLP